MLYMQGQRLNINPFSSSNSACVHIEVVCLQKQRTSCLSTCWLYQSTQKQEQDREHGIQLENSPHCTMDIFQKQKLFTKGLMQIKSDQIPNCCPTSPVSAIWGKCVNNKYHSSLSQCKWYKAMGVCFVRILDFTRCCAFAFFVAENIINVLFGRTVGNIFVCTLDNS